MFNGYCARRAAFGATALALVLTTAACAQQGASNETVGDQLSPKPATVEGSRISLPATSDKPDFTTGSVRFIGTATVLIQYAGMTILTDPNFLHKGQHVHLGYGLTSERLTNPAVELDAIPSIDLVLLSHMHEDHFDKFVQEKLPKATPIVTTAGAARELEKLGFVNLYPLETWSGLTVARNGATLRISAMPARHGPPVVSATLPETMGSMLEFQSAEGQTAYRMYISGDTLLYEDIEKIPKQYPDIDLALLHLGGTRILNAVLVTMDAEQGMEMLEIVAPRHAVPIHYNDYTVFKSPIEDFEKRVRDAGWKEKVTILKHGESYAFKGRSR